MKLLADRIEGVNVISGLAPGAVSVNGVAHQRSIVIPWHGEIIPWAKDGFDALTAADFEALIALQPELVIFGSGKRLRFAPAALMRSLMSRRIGIETMDTSAACRTYNVLVGEGRKAVAALLLDAPNETASDAPR